MDNFDEINLFNLDNKLHAYRIVNLKKLGEHKTQESRFNMYFNELKPNDEGEWKHKAIYLRYLKVAYNYFNELGKNNLFLALKEILYSKFLGQQYLTIAY
ncbi:26012_t:CDS:1, partial [Gigaspora rosea]